MLYIGQKNQPSGDFVIVYPFAYHGGFNLGINVAVNFVVKKWKKGS